MNKENKKEIKTEQNEMQTHAPATTLMSSMRLPVDAGEFALINVRCGLLSGD